MRRISVGDRFPVFEGRMLTWKTYLLAFLGRMARSHGSRSVREIEQITANAFDAAEVSFLDENGAPLGDGTTLDQLLTQTFRVHCQVCAAPEDQSEGLESGDQSRGASSRFRSGPAPEHPSTELDDRCDEFIREFDRQEQRHGFMWAGYIVREMLPRMGYHVDDAKVILDRLCSAGILAMCKVPNPKNPDFPATGVSLNRDHERVQTALTGFRTLENERSETEPEATENQPAKPSASPPTAEQ